MSENTTDQAEKDTVSNSRKSHKNIFDSGLNFMVVDKDRYKQMSANQNFSAIKNMDFVMVHDQAKERATLVKDMVGICSKENAVFFDSNIPDVLQCASMAVNVMNIFGWHDPETTDKTKSQIKQTLRTITKLCDRLVQSN